MGTNIPNYPSLLRIAYFFNITIDKLCEGTNYNYEEKKNKNSRIYDAGTKLSRSELERIEKVCQKRGLTKSKVIRDLINAYAHEEVI